MQCPYDILACINKQTNKLDLFYLVYESKPYKLEENHENKQRGILTYALVSQLLITLQS